MSIIGVITAVISHIHLHHWLVSFSPEVRGTKPSDMITITPRAITPEDIATATAGGGRRSKAVLLPIVLPSPPRKVVDSSAFGLWESVKRPLRYVEIMTRQPSSTADGGPMSILHFPSGTRDLTSLGQPEAAVYQVELLLYHVIERLPERLRSSQATRLDVNLPNVASVCTFGASLLLGCLSLILDVPVCAGTMVLGDVNLGWKVMPILGAADTMKAIEGVRKYVNGGVGRVLASPPTCEELRMHSGSSGSEGSDGETNCSAVKDVVIDDVRNIVDIVRKGMNWDGKEGFKKEVIEALERSAEEGGPE